MDETFITEGFFGQTSVADLGDMFDQDFADEELPDSFFVQHIPPGLSANFDIFINKENPAKGMALVELIVLSDNPDEGYIIHKGPREMEQPKIIIQPDYIPALTTLKWYFDTMDTDSIVPYPYVPPLNPSIPATMLESSASVSVMDYFFSDRGGLICYPHYDFYSKVAEQRYVYHTDSFGMKGEIHKKMAQYNYQYLFSPKYRFDEFIEEMKYPMAWMEFNPFHPLAATMIISYEDDGQIISGIRRMGRKEVPFVFDRLDKNYRIHSDMWSSVIQAYDVYSVYDIVANFDIAQHLPRMGRSSMLYYKQGKIAEIYKVVPGTYCAPYSPMMGKRTGEVKCKSYTYDSTYSHYIEEQGKEFFDVSLECSVIRTVRPSEYSVIIDSSNREIGVITGSRVRMHPGFFCNYKYGSQVEVIAEREVLNQYNLKGQLTMRILLEGVPYTNIPRNEQDGLIHPLGITSFDAMIRDTKRGSKAFFDARYEEVYDWEQEVDLSDPIDVSSLKDLDFTNGEEEDIEKCSILAGTYDTFSLVEVDKEIGKLEDHVVGQRISNHHGYYEVKYSIHHRRYNERIDKTKVMRSSQHYIMEKRMAIGAGTGKYRRRIYVEEKVEDSPKQDSRLKET